MLQAVLEGIVFNHRTHVDILADAFDVRRVRLTGGGSGRARMGQLFADGLGRPIEVPAQSEAAALGAALCAGVAVGAFEDLQAAADACCAIAGTYRPDAGAAGRARPQVRPLLATGRRPAAFLDGARRRSRRGEPRVDDVARGGPGRAQDAPPRAGAHHRRRHQRCRALPRSLAAGRRLRALRQVRHLRRRECSAVAADPWRPEISGDRRIPPGRPVDTGAQPAAAQCAALCSPAEDHHPDLLVVRRHRPVDRACLGHPGEACRSGRADHRSRTPALRFLRQPRAAACHGMA